MAKKRCYEWGILPKKGQVVSHTASNWRSTGVPALCLHRRLLTLAIRAAKKLPEIEELL